MVLSKELKEPLRSQMIQTIIKLSAPEQRDLMKTFISSIFVGFKPTTAAEHLGSLQRYLKARRTQVHGASVTERRAPIALQRREVWYSYPQHDGCYKMFRCPFRREKHRHHGAIGHRQNDLAADTGRHLKTNPRPRHGIRPAGRRSRPAPAESSLATSPNNWDSCVIYRLG